MPFRTCRPTVALSILAGLLLCGTTAAQEKPSGIVARNSSALAGDGDLPALWRSVDAVVYLRIQEAVRDHTRILNGRESVWTEYRAVVREVFRRYGGQPEASVDLLQPAGSPILSTAAPAPGPEYIAFMKWDDAEELFEPVIMVPVLDGGVQSSRIRGLESGMKLEAFLKLLRTMME